MDRIFSCNNEKMSTHSIGSNTVQCCSIWHEKARPKVTDDECWLFLMAATPVPLHNIFNQTSCMTCCFHHASWFLFLMTLIISVPPYKEHTFQPILFSILSSHLIFRRPNIVYVASNHFVWRLVPVSISSQIRQLLQDKQFELALQLAVSSLHLVIKFPKIQLVL